MRALFPRLAAPDAGVALRCNEQAVSWGELASACAVWGARLGAEGLAPGAHVGVWTQPSLETLVALVATAACGFVTVPLDPKLGTLELGHVAQDAKPVLTIAADAAAAVGRIEGTPVLAANLSSLSGTSSPLRQVNDEPLLVLYTSGTTGLPKGAVLSSGNIASNLDALAEAWAWTHADTVVHSLPLFHVHGLVLGLYGSMRVGGALHWLPRFDPHELSKALAARQTMLFAVPTTYHRCVEAAEDDPSIARGLREARLLVSGSAALPQRDQARIERLTGKRVLERYGLTETIINTASRADGEVNAGTVGTALRGVEVRLVDDQRTPIDARDDSTIGEVAVRGPNVFLGYLNRPDATKAVRDADGWFYTGDLACMRPGGVLRIVGRRATELIKCGGYKVGAGEVEAALLEHPLVREAAVIGAPDADLGERIVAFVVAKAGLDLRSLEEHVATLLSPHKRPRELHLVPELPRNAMGKVLKNRLRGALS